MTLNDYQEIAQSYDLTKGTPKHKSHAIFQFLEEAGEVAGILKRALRGDYNHVHKDEPREELVVEGLKKELGDCLWGISAIAASHGFTLEDIALSNIAKLEDRRARGKIQGKGDER